MKWLTEKRIWETKRQARMRVKEKEGRFGENGLTIELRHPDCFLRFQRGESPNGIIGDVRGMNGNKFFYYYIVLLQVTPSLKIALI